MNYSSFYSDYAKKLEHLSKKKAQSSWPKIIVLFGDCEFHHLYSISTIKSIWRSQDGDFHSLPVEKYHLSDFNSIFDDLSLFEKKSLYYLSSFEKNKKSFDFLSNTSKVNTSNTSIAFSFYSKTIPQKFLKLLEKLDAYFIHCLIPKKHELAQVIDFLCLQKKIQLSAEANSLLIQYLGDDLNKLDNELNKISLIFKDKSKILGVNDISSYLDIIKEDHAFNLHQLILEGKKKEAELLIIDLLNRGDNALAILGLLIRFCRNCIEISSRSQGKNQAQSVKFTFKLPSFVIRSYTKYIKSRDLSSLNQALKSCFEADIALKTNSFLPPEIILSSILLYL